MSRLGQPKVVHGESYPYPTKEYRTRKGIQNRCRKSSKDHIRYFDRGITVCQRWVESYSNFLEDMGRCPDVRLQIERVDNNRGYEPGNCIWATVKVNGNNKRNNRFYVYNGIQYNIRELAAEIRCNTASIWFYVNHGKSVEWIADHFRNRNINRELKAAYA